jgi:hypothetical protein
VLYLAPPFYVIDGVNLFRDHADPTQYYYLPTAPHLTTRRDDDRHVDVPTLHLVVYRGARANGGFLTFDVDLGLTVDLDELASKLKKEAKLDSTPRLAPVPIVDGTVKLLLLGAESPDATAPAPKTPAPSNGFVVKIESARKPSLYGDEQATFSVQLDEWGAKLLQDVLGGTASECGIVYSLDFIGLRPAYCVKVTVDWDRVQHHLDESFTVNVTFFSSQIDKVVDELIESQAIHLEATKLVDGSEPDAKDVAAAFDTAKAEARDMIKSTFFQSSIPPPGTGPDDIDKASRVADKFSQLAASGGLSAFASFGYRKIDITRIDKKSLNATFDEATTIRKTIYPQGQLGGLFRAVQAGVPLKSFTETVDVESAYFQRRTIEVISRADFERDGIKSIDVRLEYGGEPKNIIIDSKTTDGRGKLDWPSVLTPVGAMVRPVNYSYKVTFKDADRSQRPVSLDTAELGMKRWTVEDQLEIDPRSDLYAMAQIPIRPMPGFPWDRYPQVDVSCRYTDEANEVHEEQSFRLNAATTQADFTMFMRDPGKREFEVKVTYHGSDGSDVVQPWAPGEDEQVLIRDPFPKVIQLAIVPQVDWNATDRVFVDLKYEPDDVEASYEFNQKDSGSKTFVCHPKDPTQKLVAYDVTILTRAGAQIRVPRSYTADRRLIVRSDMRGHRVVGVTSDGKPFGGAHVVSIDVDLRYVDDAHGLLFADRFVFKQPNEHAAFEYDYVDEAKNRYDFKTTTHFDNGLASETDWASANDATLTVPVG